MSQSFAQIAGSLAGGQIVEISNRADKIRKLELELAELRQQVEKMKSCNNCKHKRHDANFGNECTDPNLTEKTRNEYYNGCEHWRPKDAA